MSPLTMATGGDPRRAAATGGDPRRAAPDDVHAWARARLADGTAARAAAWPLAQRAADMCQSDGETAAKRSWRYYPGRAIR